MRNPEGKRPHTLALALPAVLAGGRGQLRAPYDSAGPVRGGRDTYGAGLRQLRVVVQLQVAGVLLGPRAGRGRQTMPVVLRHSLVEPKP